MSSFPTIFIDFNNPFENTITGINYNYKDEKNIYDTDLIKRILLIRKDAKIIVGDISLIPINEYIIYIPFHTLFINSCPVDSEWFIPFIEHIEHLCQNREKKIFFVYSTFVSFEIMNRLKQYILFTTNINFVRRPSSDRAFGFTTFYPLVSSKMPDVEFRKNKILVSEEPEKYIELRDEESIFSMTSIKKDYKNGEGYLINIYQFIEDICDHLDKYKEQN